MYTILVGPKTLSTSVKTFSYFIFGLDMNLMVYRAKCISYIVINWIVQCQWLIWCKKMETRILLTKKNIVNRIFSKDIHKKEKKVGFKDVKTNVLVMWRNGASLSFTPHGPQERPPVSGITALSASLVASCRSLDASQLFCQNLLFCQFSQQIKMNCIFLAGACCPYPHLSPCYYLSLSSVFSFSSKLFSRP